MGESSTRPRALVVSFVLVLVYAAAIATPGAVIAWSERAGAGSDDLSGGFFWIGVWLGLAGVLVLVLDLATFLRSRIARAILAVLVVLTTVYVAYILVLAGGPVVVLLGIVGLVQLVGVAGVVLLFLPSVRWHFARRVA